MRSGMIKANTTMTSDWDMVSAQLPTGWKALAKDMALLEARPEQLGAKVDDIEAVLRVVLYQAGASDSLRATAARAAAVGLLAVSHVALHKWMKNSRRAG